MYYRGRDKNYEASPAFLNKMSSKPEIVIPVLLLARSICNYFPGSRKEHSISFGASDASRSANVLHGVGEYSIYVVLVAPACGG
jgi:hypothetical protein